MKRSQLKAGALLSYLQMALHIVVGLIYTPQMIRLLGQSEYGLYNTVSSTISMLSILSLGFNACYIRFFARYNAKDDSRAVAKLNGLFLIIFSMIGLIALACGLFLSNHLSIVFDEGLTDAEYAKARILMLLLTFNLSVSFPMTVFSCIISAHERFVFLKTLGMLKTVVSPLVILPLLLMGYRSIAMVSVTVAISLITDIVYIIFVFRNLRVRFSFRDFEKGLLKEMFAFTFFIALNIVINQINLNIDKLLLARFKGTAMVAVYSVGFALYGYYESFSTSISNVFTPRIHKLVNAFPDPENRRAALTDLFTRVGRIQFLILGLIMSGLVFFGKNFITNFWAGAGYTDSYYVALLLIIPATIPLIQNLGLEIQRAQNKHQFRSIAYTIIALLNLLTSIYLCQLYGAVGSAIGTCFATIIGNGIIMNIYYQKRCNIDVIYFWKEILRLSKGLILPAVAGILIIKFVDLNSVLVFWGCIVGYSALYVASMWLLGINEYEKELIRKPIRKIILRKHGF